MQLVDRHWTDLNKRAVEEILDALLGRSQLDPLGAIAGGVLDRAFRQELKQRTSRPQNACPHRREDFLGLPHRRRSMHLMRCGHIYIQIVTLDVGLILRLGGAAGNDQVLLVDKPFLDGFADVVPAVPIFIRLIHAALHKVIPTKDLFAPKLKAVEQLQVRAVSQRQFFFAILDPALYHFAVVIDARVGDQVINSIHLHGNLFVDWNLSAHHGIPKHAVILWNGCIR